MTLISLRSWPLRVWPGRGTGKRSSGAKRRYCFTLARPLAVEPEDVPEEVTAVLLDARLLWELHVEGSTVPEVPHAVRFARRLATAARGVVLDLQTGQTWHRGVLRTPPPVSRGFRVGVGPPGVEDGPAVGGLALGDRPVAVTSHDAPTRLAERSGGAHLNPFASQFASRGLPGGFATPKPQVRP